MKILESPKELKIFIIKMRGEIVSTKDGPY